ncbi:MAG: hypothetical protein RMJ88_16490 [Thermogemmata sp.]|nr:hypothetical protein [Thermogemmata sp.]
MQVICEVAADPELQDRRQALHDTYDNPNTASTTGLTHLAELLGDAAAVRLSEYYSYALSRSQQ